MTAPYSSWVIQLLHHTILPSPAPWIFMPSGTFPTGEIATEILKGVTVITLSDVRRSAKGTCPWSSSGTQESKNSLPLSGLQVEDEKYLSQYLITKLPFLGSAVDHILKILSQLKMKTGKYLLWKLKILSC